MNDFFLGIEMPKGKKLADLVWDYSVLGLFNLSWTPPKGQLISKGQFAILELNSFVRFLEESSA